MSNDWRIDVTAVDYLTGQNKKVATEERRPTIRKASDLVGPGIASTAVRITDFNDLLATFNGYYSAAAGADYAPNTTDSFIGSVIADDLLGGVQTFTSLETGVQYDRTFLRSPGDEASIAWGLWRSPVDALPTVYSETALVASSQTVSDLPTGTTNGFVMSMPKLTVTDPDTFAPSTHLLGISRPGIYSGYLWARTTEDFTLTNVQVQFPNGAAQTTDVMQNVPGLAGIQIPLNFYASNGLGSVRVSAKQVTGSTKHFEFKRLHLTRLGDG